jgi:hypothetical protein
MAAQELARQLSSKSSKNLTVLTLEGNSIGSVGVKFLAQALEDNMSVKAMDIDRS